MTCPSPNVFQTDKGRFAPGSTSPYPPRNDLIEFDPGVDSPDVEMFAELNDLDAVTAATPPGDRNEFITATIPAALADRGPLTAWIEVNLEHDENDAYDSSTASNDHFVDPRLASYGVEYLGQPSVVYKLAFDPRTEGFPAPPSTPATATGTARPAPSTRPTPPSAPAPAAAPTASSATPSTARLPLRRVRLRRRRHDTRRRLGHLQAAAAARRSRTSRSRA
jgi:hypothetical protein